MPAAEGPSLTPQPTVGEKALGWIAGFAVLFLNLIAFFVASGIAAARASAVAAGLAGRHWWADDPWWVVVPPIAMAIIPIWFIPGAFGVEGAGRMHQMLPYMPRHRWRVVAGFAAAGLVLAIPCALVGGTRVGSFDDSGATWLRKAGPIARFGWDQARSIRLQCQMVQRGRHGPEFPVAGVEIGFPGRRTVRFERLQWEDRATLASWLDQVGPRVAQARTKVRRVHIAHYVEKACIDGMTEGLPLEDANRFRRFLDRPPSPG